MAKLYRQLHELEAEWGGKLGKKHVQQIILTYHRTVDRGVLVTLEQFQEIIRGALNIEVGSGSFDTCRITSNLCSICA